MVWGAIGAATIAGGASLLGNAMNYASSKKLMNRQHKLQKQYAQYLGENSHQWTVKDLQAAGLNPVLSATQGANATSGGNVGLPQAPDYAGSLQSAVQTYMDNKRIENETEVAEATAENQKAQANKNNEESGMIKPKAEAEIKNLTSNTAINSAKINEIESKIELNKTINELNKLEKTRKKGTKEYLGGKTVEYGQQKIINAKVKKRIEELKKQLKKY